MADTIQARQGETLDALIWRERALGPENLGPVLATNPGLAALGPVLPTATRVILPASAPAPVVRDMLQLWDD